MVISALCVVAVLLGDVPPRMSGCESDDDCLITTEGSCCSCCPGVPRAVSRSEPQPDCSTKNCGIVPCKATRCKPAQDPSTLQAICRAGTCRAEPVKVKKNPSFCSSDAECVVTSFSCCDTCCPTPPIAATQAELELKRGQCADTMCAMIRCAKENCPAQPQPGPAVCRSSHCVIGSVEPTPAPQGNECRRDADCTVSYPVPDAENSCHRSACGCCPGAPVAVPAGVPMPRRVGKPPKPKVPAKSPFGLSQPGANCSPCPAPAAASAACLAGRCALR